MTGAAIDPILPDRTGCTHKLVELFGVVQCINCGRYFSHVETPKGWRLQIELPKRPPGPGDYCVPCARDARHCVCPTAAGPGAGEDGSQ